MAEGDKVVLVGKSHDTLSIVLGHGEERLEDTRDAFSEAGSEAIKDEVGVLLGNGRVGGSHVVSESDIVERHAQRRAVGEVANDHGIGHAAVFVYEHEVRNALREARLHQVLHNGVTTVKSDSVWEAEAEFL